MESRTTQKTLKQKRQKKKKNKTLSAHGLENKETGEEETFNIT